MKGHDFLDKVLQSTFCPNGFVEEYEYFCHHQQLVLKTLRDFHRVCEQSNINYHVTYGSLLGIIRDGGQIPWDYDIDTFVPVNQRLKMIESLYRELSDDYVVMCPELYDNCRHYIVRLCPKNYNSAAIHLDVFYYCGAPNELNERTSFNHSLQRCSQIRYAKKVDINEESIGKAKRRVKLTIAKMGSVFFNLEKNDSRYKRLIEEYPIKQSDYVVSADFFADLFLFPKSMLEETMLYSSDIGEFRIPKDYKGFLKLVYGNYLEYPSLESCIKQVLAANQRFRYYESL